MCLKILIQNIFVYKYFIPEKISYFSKKGAREDGHIPELISYDLVNYHKCLQDKLFYTIV